MPRRALDPYARGITVRLPAVLIDAVDRYARDEFTLRSEAVRALLERRLAAAGRPLTIPEKRRAR